MKSGRHIGIDQGTTSTRVLSIERGQAPRLLHAIRHQQSYPRPGWVEHDPTELLANIRQCIKAGGGADTIGIANQGESCLAWNAKTKQPLSPVIVWTDNRTTSVIEALRATGAADEVLLRAGLPLDPYFSASKLGWLLQNSPGVQAARQTGCLLLGTTDAFFLDSLTGCFKTDVTTASRTSLMNLRSHQWDPVLCKIFGVAPELLPEITDSVAAFGEVDGIPITASLVDQQAALFGHGCRQPGDTKITFGTGAFALAVTGNDIIRAPERGLLPTVAWRFAGQTTYAVDGGVYDAGSAVDWGHKLGIFDRHADLNQFAATPAISRGLAFVPALSGLACPHWDRTAAAVWIGMTANTTRTDLAQSILEGIAFRAAELIQEIDRHVTINGAIRIDGGLAQSDYFVQFLCDVLHRQIARPHFTELTAFGCARLGAGSSEDNGFSSGADITTFNPAARFDFDAHGRFAEAVARSKTWR